MLHSKNIENNLTKYYKEYSYTNQWNFLTIFLHLFV